MVEVFDCPIISKINNKTFRNKLIKYTLKNKCCSDYPDCNHPQIQSDLKVDEEFPCIKKSILNLFTNYLETKAPTLTKDIAELKEAVLNLEVMPSMRLMMTAGEACERDNIVMYITPTDLGTDFYDFKIKPEINKWYVWHSGLFHEPEDGITKEDRLVIALSSVIV